MLIYKTFNKIIYIGQLKKIVTFAGFSDSINSLQEMKGFNIQAIFPNFIKFKSKIVNV